jgi:anti-sigma factor RsiW
MTRPDPDAAIALLLGPAGPEILCEECFARLDAYVESELLQADAEAAVPGMRAHLEGCPACWEDYESLRAMVAQERPDGRPPEAGPAD